jgi:hypothetical protein
VCKSEVRGKILVLTTGDVSTWGMMPLNKKDLHALYRSQCYRIEIRIRLSRAGREVLIRKQEIYSEFWRINLLESTRLEYLNWGML